jgi:hypothetical protein
MAHSDANVPRVRTDRVIEIDIGSALDFATPADVLDFKCEIVTESHTDGEEQTARLSTQCGDVHVSPTDTTPDVKNFTLIYTDGETADLQPALAAVKGNTVALRDRPAGNATGNRQFTTTGILKKVSTPMPNNGAFAFSITIEGPTVGSDIPA